MIILLVVAVIACIFTFFSVVAFSVSTTKILLFVLLILFIISLIFTFMVVFKRR